MKKANVIYFPHASRVTPQPAFRVSCMFSNMPRTQYNAALPNHQEGLLDIVQRAGINVLWQEMTTDARASKSSSQQRYSQHFSTGLMQRRIMLR
ncbi:MAG: hypothetical protein ACR5LD_03415 [Symbiopectobacterium sp.]